MNCQGKIINWNDEKGFGFVEPSMGGVRAFVHIKSFQGRQRRPLNGDLIIYQTRQQADGRYKAEHVRFANQAVGQSRPLRHAPSASSSRHLGTVFSLLFCLGLVLLGYFEKLPLLVPVAYAVVSFITFIVYASDKSAAQQQRWRTQESTLHILALIGGWPGAFWAQNILRHKCSKRDFKFMYWVTVLLNLMALLWLFSRQGQALLNTLPIRELSELVPVFLM